MKVAAVPAQTVVVPAMLTLTGKFGFTVIVKELAVAGFPVGQTALDVRTHVTTSPLDSELAEVVALLGPTLLPFNFH